MKNIITEKPLTLSDLLERAEKGTVREQVLQDADGDVDYIRGAAEHGCIGGNCSNLICYSDTHAFTAKHMDEINDIVDEARNEYGFSIDNADFNGDLFNFLAWFAYEVRAQEIMKELEPEE